MQRIIFALIFLGFGLVAHAQSSLYSIRIPLANGTDTIDFASLQGKKILIVNTATQSGYTNSVAELQQLYLQFKDSGLVVIACPSNSFGNEPISNAEIVSWYYSSRFLSFPVTERLAATGVDAHPLYRWISSKVLNGVMSARIRTDFTKILINAQGQIVGFFDGSVSPMHHAVLKAIRNN